MILYMTFARNNETWSGVGEELEYDYHFLTRTCLLAGFLLLSILFFYFLNLISKIFPLGQKWYLPFTVLICVGYWTNFQPIFDHLPSTSTWESFNISTKFFLFWISGWVNISICDQYLTCQNMDMSESGPTSL